MAELVILSGFCWWSFRTRRNPTGGHLRVLKWVLLAVLVIRVGPVAVLGY